MGMFQRHQRGQAPTHREPDDMYRVGVQPANEGRQVGEMGRGRVVLPVVRPWGRAVVAEIVGYEAVFGGDGLSLGFPVPKVHPSTVYKDNRRARSLIDV